MVHQDHLDQHLCPNLLEITHIKLEEVITDQKQHQYMDQNKNLI